MQEPGRVQFIEQLDVSCETLERLDTFHALIRKWNKAINLVAPADTSELWTRHFLDSAQLMPRLPTTGTSWLDLGSGGGMPAIVCSILAVAEAPQWRITCIESDQRKATFLRTVVRDLSLSVDVRAERVENLEGKTADLITARALSPLVNLISYADHLLRPGGTCLFLKGARHQEEIEVALAKWHFKLNTYPSMTEPSAAVLSIGEITRA